MTFGGVSMSQAVPQDPVAYEAWLQESLTVRDAAKFLCVEEQWLNRARMDGTGPEFTRLTPRQIVYVRRDLVRFRDDRRHRSTSEYQSASTPSEGDG